MNLLIDTYADHIVMNLLSFEKYHPSAQMVYVGASIQVLTQNLPSLIITCYVFNMLRCQVRYGFPPVNIHTHDGIQGLALNAREATIRCSGICNH